MLLVRAWVGPSLIHGFGLIAHEFIPAGTIVWKFTPGFDLALSEAELSAYPPPVQEQVRHYGFFDDSLNRHVLSVDDERFVNHSDDANTRYHRDHSIAVRDIHPGDEITDDYTEYGKPVAHETRPPRVSA